MNRSKLPRKDVGAAVLSAPLAAVFFMVLSHGTYNYNAVYAVVFGLVVAGAGYLAKKNKSFVMLVAAPLATIAAAVLGKMLYGVEWDNAAVSAAGSAFVVALVGYLAPASNPEESPVAVIDKELGAYIATKQRVN